MKVSILIAVKGNNDFLKECVDKCLGLDYQDYEIIILPDVYFEWPDNRVTVVETGSCLPAKKRDIGALKAGGQVLAFLDDDTYPQSNWLKVAISNFSDPEIAAVGGPAVTPENDTFKRRASGRIYESFMVSGNMRYRYVKAKKRLIDDYPSCNFLIRKDIFDKLGGFKINYWPGEDTHLCLELTKRLDKKIVYDPDVLVFHHRREVFAGHLKQIKSYGFHRGYFAKRFPETSLRWYYFVPSFFVIWIIGGFFISLINPVFLKVYVTTLSIYFLLAAASAFNATGFFFGVLIFLGILLSHIYYGLFFLLGLMNNRLSEEENV